MRGLMCCTDCSLFGVLGVLFQMTFDVDWAINEETTQHCVLHCFTEMDLQMSCSQWKTLVLNSLVLFGKES